MKAPLRWITLWMTLLWAATASAQQPLTAAQVLEQLPAFAQAAQADPAAAKRHNADGLKAHRAQQWDLALSHYLAALKADPAHLLARYNLACALSRRGEREGALTVLGQIKGAGCERCAAQLAHAAKDEDFKALHGDPRLAALLAPPAQAPAPSQAPVVAEAPEEEEEEDYYRFPKLPARPDVSAPRRLGAPPARPDAQAEALPPQKRFVAWKRALPDFCTRRDIKTLEVSAEAGGPWIYAWSFEGVVPDPACYHEAAGLVISPRGQAPISARCPQKVEARDFDGDGHKDLFITHKDCDHPDLTGAWIELCLDRPGAVWCAVVARDVLSARWLRVNGRLTLRVVRSDEPELAIEHGDEFPYRTWLDLAWEEGQVTARRYDNREPPAGQEAP